ncbi:Endoglucanase 24 [Bienertia sinuspersici]
MEKEKGSKGGCCGWFLVFIVAAAIVIGLVVAFRSKFHHSDSDKPEPVPGPPGAIVTKYSDSLKLAMQFFDVQKSGKLKDNKISWRGDSALDDGKEAKLDLSKGMYDAGDNMKFGFPLAFTATVLSWAILEYGDQMAAVKQLQPAQENLKWITDFLINAHPKDNVLYIQVGDPEVDHKCWNRPEDMTEKRPLTQVNVSTPGTEVAAETAAAMAAASLVFKSSDSTYSSMLLKHAKQLFDFADKHRGSYSENIPEVATYYNSTGYGDELLWAASWLYHATKDSTYLEFVNDNGKEFANFGSPTWFSWDNKLAGTQVLLSRVNLFSSKDISSSANSGLQTYRQTAEAVMCGLLPKSPTATSSRTDGGLIWVSDWNALQHPVAAAFLAVIYSDYMLSSRTARISCDGHSYKPSDLRKFAVSQADYVLGDNPMKLSYLVGYGDKFPQFVHHRGASIPADAKTGCEDGFKWLNSSKPNPNVAVGALVGGPFLNETFIDDRNNSMQTEPSTYNTALVVGLLSGLVTSSSVVPSFT